MVPRVAWLAVGTVASALIARHVPGAGWLVPLIVAAAIALVRPASRVAAIAFGVGVALVLLRIGIGVLVAPPLTTLPLIEDARDWVGQVVTLGTPGDGRQRAFVDVTAADAAAGSPSVRIYAQLPRYPELAPGDRIVFRGALEPPPEGPGFADYLARNGAVATCRIRSFSPGGLMPGPLPDLERARRDAADLLARVLPAQEAGLAAGMLIGLRDRVDRQVAADFTASGLSHVVAISGWNIALVGALIAAALRRVPRRPRSLLLVLGIAVYAVAAGASPSVVRAAVMGGVVLVARESGRRGAAPVALGIATAGLLAVEPPMVDDAGFRLSVAATAGLLAWAAPLTQLLRHRIPRRIPAWLVESLAVSLAAQAATLPLVLMDFGRLSLIAPVANLAVAPLVAPAMLAGTLALLAGGALAIGAPAVIGMAAATAGWAVLGSIIAIARLAASLPLSSLEVGTPWNLGGAVLAAIGLALCGTSRGRAMIRKARSRPRGQPLRHRRGPAALLDRRSAAITSTTAGARWDSRMLVAAVAAGTALLTLVVLVAASRPDGRLRITVLDVGQGDALLLEGPRGGRLLIDTGPDPDQLLPALDARLPPWDRRLDLVVLTHPHEDHVAGLALLLERYAVTAVAENGMHGNGPGDAAYRRELQRRGHHTAVLAQGDEIGLDGAAIHVLWPPARSLPERAPSSGRAINDSSLVLDLRFGERRFLLTGDVEDDIDPRLLGAGIAEGGTRLDFLKVAHHGSGTATTQGFVDALRPRVAAVSVGSDNDYGHPSERTIERLEASGAEVFRTDLDGTMSVSSDGHDLQVDARTARLAFVAPRMAAKPAAMPRIGGWPSPAEPKASTCCVPSSRRAGSFATASRSPRWLPSSPTGWPARASLSTATWSRRPHSCTTSTSSSTGTIPCGPLAMGTPARAGSTSTATVSWLGRSPPIPSAGSAIRSGIAAGPRSRTVRAASWRMPTSAPASASGRSPPGSTRWSGGIPSTSPPCAPLCPVRCGSNARCALPPASVPPR